MYIITANKILYPKLRRVIPHTEYLKALNINVIIFHESTSQAEGMRMSSAFVEKIVHN